MAVRDESGAFASVSFTSPFSMNALSVNSTFSTLKGQNWHTWRFDIKRNADTGSPAVRHYVCDVYYEDHKVASDVPVDNDSVAGTTFVRMEMDTTGDAAGATDVEVDSLDIQAEVQEIRGLFEFSEDPTDIEGATRKRAIYAGSRIYLDIGNAFNIPCIDDGLDKDQFCSFEVFESRIRPFRLDALRTQSTT